MKDLKDNDQNYAKILVTGGCGYLGSQFLRQISLSKRWQGKTIRILDNMQAGGYKALMHLPPLNYEFIEGDILDGRVLRYALNDVEAVVHLAAIVRTPLNFENSAWINQVNRWGTAQLAETCLSLGVRRMIFASSAVVYGPGGPFREDDPCRPLGAYAQSKIHAEESLSAMQGRGLDTTILRFGTLYGLAPVMRFEAIVNRFAYLAGTGRALTIYGSGQQKRPFLHVKDAADILLFCLEHAETTAGEIFNAHDESASVLEISSLIEQIEPDIETRYTEQDILTHLSFDIDSAKLRSLGWAPQVSLHAGIQELFEQFVHIRRALPLEATTPDEEFE